MTEPTYLPTCLYFRPRVSAPNAASKIMRNNPCGIHTSKNHPIQVARAENFTGGGSHAPPGPAPRRRAGRSSLGRAFFAGRAFVRRTGRSPCSTTNAPPDGARPIFFSVGGSLEGRSPPSQSRVSGGWQSPAKARDLSGGGPPAKVGVWGVAAVPG